MFGTKTDSASATFFFITDHRATDRTVAEMAWCTPTHAAVTWVYRPRKPRPPQR